MTAEMSNAEYLRALRHQAALDGICTTCRIRPSRPQRRTCSECAKRSADARAAAIAAGKCRCGRDRDTEHKQCSGCRSCDAALKAREHTAAQRIAEQGRHDVAASVARHAELEVTCVLHGGVLTADGCSGAKP